MRKRLEVNDTQMVDESSVKSFSSRAEHARGEVN